MDDGSLRSSKYGLVTIGGVVVTDLIYDDIQRAESMDWHIGGDVKRFPAYRLSVNIPVSETPHRIYPERRSAVCAPDGSWVTPFDYQSVLFSGKVIILIRDERAFDIDVIDYNGNHLYNMKDFYWANHSFDTWYGLHINLISDDYAHIMVQDDKYVLIDLQTGSAQYLEFESIYSFNEGLAAVAVRLHSPDTGNRLWGFANTEFEIVIPPTYIWPSVFINGLAIVQLTDDIQKVINTQGEVVFDVPQGHWLDYNFDGGSLFILQDRTGERRSPIIYSSDFEPVILFDDMDHVDYYFIRYLGNGWYTASVEDNSLMVKNDVVHEFPGVRYIEFSDGEFIVYMTPASDQNYDKHGIMTINGDIVTAPEENLRIIPVIENDKIVKFTLNTGSGWFYQRREYTPSVYRLIDTKGNIITQGSGVLTYHEYLELYSIQSENHFSWLDKDANLIISIPIMSSVFD